MTTKTTCDVCDNVCDENSMQVVLKVKNSISKRQTFDVCNADCLQDLCHNIAIGDVELKL